MPRSRKNLKRKYRRSRRGGVGETPTPTPVVQTKVGTLDTAMTKAQAEALRQETEREKGVKDIQAQVEAEKAKAELKAAQTKSELSQAEQTKAMAEAEQAKAEAAAAAQDITRKGKLQLDKTKRKQEYENYIQEVLKLDGVLQKKPDGTTYTQEERENKIREYLSALDMPMTPLTEEQEKARLETLKQRGEQVKEYSTKTGFKYYDPNFGPDKCPGAGLGLINKNDSKSYVPCYVPKSQAEIVANNLKGEPGSLASKITGAKEIFNRRNACGLAELGVLKSTSYDDRSKALVVSEPQCTAYNSLFGEGAIKDDKEIINTKFKDPAYKPAAPTAGGGKRRKHRKKSRNNKRKSKKHLKSKKSHRTKKRQTKKRVKRRTKHTRKR